MSRIVDLLILGGIACLIYSIIVKLMGKDLLISTAQAQPGTYLQLAVVILLIAVAISLVQIRDRLK